VGSGVGVAVAVAVGLGVAVAAGAVVPVSVAADGSAAPEPQAISERELITLIRRIVNNFNIAIFYPVILKKSMVILFCFYT
jgi:hypothetical protein